MHSRIALPLLILLASGCGQVPANPENPLSERSVPSAEPVQVAPIAPAAADAPAAAASPASLARDLRSRQVQAADSFAQNRILLKPDEELEPPSNSLWSRITRGFALPPLDNDLVRQWENWYANRPDYVARMIGRSSRFLFHIVEQVEKHNMPMEIALLPMIESAYNPVAYSKAHASGIWQFIPSTGKDYGLRQNWWYDGRRDVIRATGAALDYLARLYNMFGDWQLALASYNWGEGAVGRAMERNRAQGLPTDYESLTIPAETRNYIPKLIAVKNIISNPERYGLQIADIPNEPYFDTVTLKRHIDVKLAAKLAEMPVEEFKFLNPGHNKLVIRAGEAERIVLPRHKIETFFANYQKYDKPLVSWHAVTLKKGEKAERVAAQHGMTLEELKQVNGLQAQNKLVVGQPLLVPLREGAGEPQLPDLPVAPLSLPKAIQAAKDAAIARNAVVTRGARSGVQKAAVQKALIQPRLAQKGREPPRALRAEHGKRVKFVFDSGPRKTANKATPSPAFQRVKVASR